MILIYAGLLLTFVGGPCSGAVVIYALNRRTRNSGLSLAAAQTAESTAATDAQRSEAEMNRVTAARSGFEMVERLQANFIKLNETQERCRKVEERLAIVEANEHTLKLTVAKLTGDLTQANDDRMRLLRANDQLSVDLASAKATIAAQGVQIAQLEGKVRNLEGAA